MKKYRYDTSYVELNRNTTLKIRSVDDINEASDMFNALLAFAESSLRRMKGSDKNEVRCDQGDQ